MCAIMGVWNHPDASRLTYLGLYAMQHRGQESAGIVSLFEKKHLMHKGLGLVGDVFKDSDLERLQGNTAIGHVRYSTTGQNLLNNAQPLSAELLNGPVAIAHNGNIVNTEPLKKELQQQGAIFHATSDTETILHLLSRTPTGNLVEGIESSVKKLEGAFSLVVLGHECLIAVRDKWGFRPLVVGKKISPEGGTAWVVASETCAFDLIGAEFVREIEPGEMWWVDSQGVHSKKITPSVSLAKCVFEHVYFARADSVVFEKSTYQSRKNFGKWLAKEKPVDADIVIPVPDSGTAAALGYSLESKIPFEFGIIRNHYVGRTFIQPHQSIRDFGVKIKLNPQAALLKGRRVIVVDDSLVRGTTSRKIVSLLRSAGASEVHMRIASPPTVGPCFYGIDTPKRSQLIAAQKSVDEIRDFIGADSLSYLSIDGLFHAMNAEEGRKSGFCAACFDGKYPTPIAESDLI